MMTSLTSYYQLTSRDEHLEKGAFNCEDSQFVVFANHVSVLNGRNVLHPQSFDSELTDTESFAHKTHIPVLHGKLDLSPVMEGSEIQENVCTCWFGSFLMIALGLIVGWLCIIKNVTQN